ncbi:hypothetical protein [Shewanella sp. NFH-SH190041]|uniref:hypothetical protein n=1 Tax=Shewanella sp. NFH-SH190041 TaxID=2950245 RepID=UPI0021C34DBD|nr:hypothetical protein [Shewanella sp. NFH-SH190041]
MLLLMALPGVFAYTERLSLGRYWHVMDVFSYLFHKNHTLELLVVFAASQHGGIVYISAASIPLFVTK